MLLILLFQMYFKCILLFESNHLLKDIHVTINLTLHPFVENETF